MMDVASTAQPLGTIIVSFGGVGVLDRRSFDEHGKGRKTGASPVHVSLSAPGRMSLLPTAPQCFQPVCAAPQAWVECMKW